MIVRDDPLERIDDYLAIHEHRDTVARPQECVQIMRDHDDRQVQRVSQVQHEIVERSGRDGIEAGSGLVEEQDRGVERERAGQRGALDHPA